MQRVGYHVAVSVDGFIAEPNGGFGAFSMTGDHVKDYLATLREVGTVIMGRRTYQVALDVGVRDPYPHVDTLVFSKSLAESPHPHVQVVTGDIGARVASLREQDGKGVCLVGGGQVAAQLLAAQLIDELVVKVNPFVMGAGIRLFEGEFLLARLGHQSTKVFANGVVVSSYRVNYDGSAAD
jgi:dihydrofolate reductase